MSGSVTIIGGGIAGLSVAFELTRRGRSVTVVEAGRIGGGASATATSYMEPRFGRGASRRLEWESLRRWPAFARDLGVDLSFAQWRIAYADDEPRIRADMEKRRALGWSVDWLDAPVLRREADLSPEIVGAALVRDPAWVDGPAVCRALADAIRMAGGEIREKTLVTDLPPGTVVLANGAGAPALSEHVPPVRTVKGTTLAYRTDLRLPRMLRHPDISIVPRPDGVVVGASKEEEATSLEPDPAVVSHLHERAVRALPSLAAVEPFPSTAFRAYVPDRALALGNRGDLWWSLGHGGVGYLRAPVVAQELSDAVCGRLDAFQWTESFARRD